MNVTCYGHSWYRHAIKYEKTRTGSLDIDFTEELDFIDRQTAPITHQHFRTQDFREFRGLYGKL